MSAIIASFWCSGFLQLQFVQCLTQRGFCVLRNAISPSKNLVNPFRQRNYSKTSTIDWGLNNSFLWNRWNQTFHYTLAVDFLPKRWMVCNKIKGKRSKFWNISTLLYSYEKNSFQNIEDCVVKVSVNMKINVISLLINAFFVNLVLMQCAVGNIFCIKLNI